MSPELKSFYQAYTAWLDDGAPEDAPFSRCNGLCSNLIRFMKQQAVSLAQCWPLANELEQQFDSRGLSDSYPFGDVEEYENECNANECHLNPLRIAWVKEHAA